MDNIKKVGHNIWLVNGKVIGAHGDGVFDDATLEGRAVLAKVANTALTSPVFPRGRDPLYTAVFKNCSDGSGQRFVCNCDHLRTLPEDVKAALREEMPEYADRF